MYKHGQRIQLRRLTMSNYDYFPRAEMYKAAITKASREMIDHPDHYNFGEIEAIDVIEDQGLGEAFCAANVIKYIMRYKHKGTSLEDLKKVKWYTERLISYYENNNKK
jgi:hypothetical protein